MLSKNYSRSHEKPQKYEDKYLKYLKKTLIYNSIHREIKSDEKYFLRQKIHYQQICPARKWWKKFFREKENNTDQKRESTLRKSDKEGINQDIFLILNWSKTELFKVIIKMNLVIIVSDE